MECIPEDSKSAFSILEIGCGYLPSHLRLQRDDVIHIDIRKDAHHIELLCDTHKLPYADNSFDIIFCSHVLEHCYNPVQVLKEFERVTKSKVILHIPNNEHFKKHFESYQHLYSWNRNTFSQLLSTLFSSVDVKTRFKLPTKRFMQSQGKIKKLYYFLKLFTLNLLFGDNEIIAICKK